MADYAKYKRAAKGDIAYNMMRLWQGAVGVAPVDGLVSPAYVVASPYPDVESRYYAYLFRTAAYMNEVNKFSHGIVSDRNRLYWDEFKQMPSVFPPRDEQKAIADYLDAQAVMVSRFIRNRRKLIALLDEQKQTAVRQAVTRGLGDALGFKDSRVDWLGAVPAHWVVAALRLRYSVELGKMLDEKRITGEHLVPYLRNIDVQWDKINAEGLPRMDIKPHEYRRYTLENGDMLVCEGGDVGRSAFWQGKIPICGYQKALHRLRPLDRSLDSPRFLYYVMLAASKRGVFAADGSENTIAHLTAEKLRRHRFAFPPKAEQDEICARLDQELRTLDEAVSNQQHQIALIREHRARLIADVVTGELDVRWPTSRAAPGAEQPEPLEPELEPDSTDEIEDVEEVSVGDA